MNKLLWRVLGLLSLVAIQGALSPKVEGESRVKFTLEELRGAERLVNKRTVAGERHMIKAPAAALKLFPRLNAHFRRAERQLQENQQARYSPTSIDSIVASHELDIDLRERFNTVLKGIKQDIGAQEDYFGQLETIIEREEASRVKTSEAFKQARAILEEEIAPVAADDRVDYLGLSWPEELPEEVYSFLDETLYELLESRGEERAMVWRRLQRALRRFDQSHHAAQRQLQDEINMQRKLLAYDPSELFLDLVSLIDLSMTENARYNERSERAILITRGEVTPAAPDAPPAEAEEPVPEETIDLTTDTQGKGGG